MSESREEFDKLVAKTIWPTTMQPTKEQLDWMYAGWKMATEKAPTTLDHLLSKAWLKKLKKWDDLLVEVKKQGIPNHLRSQIEFMRKGLERYRDYGWKYTAGHDDDAD